MPDEKTALARRDAIEIRIGNVGLGPKLDALSAALETVAEAHRNHMPVSCWAWINKAREALAEATLAAQRGDFNLTQVGNHAGDQESALIITEYHSTAGSSRPAVQRVSGPGRKRKRKTMAAPCPSCGKILRVFPCGGDWLNAIYVVAHYDFTGRRCDGMFKPIKTDDLIEPQ